MRLSDSDPTVNRQQAERTRVSVSRLVNEIVLSLGEDFAQGNITVELDVQSLDAMAHADLIRNALRGLVHNALRAMPKGGELSVTLIDCPHQWELEVADTSNDRNDETAIAANQAGTTNSSWQSLNANSQPNMQIHPDLNAVQQAADAHGGHVQTWNCPQGGTANVLIVPKVHRNAA